MMKLLMLMVLPLLGAEGLFSPKGDVVDLTASNFQRKVVSSDRPWIVAFVAPWCGHCKALAPEYEKAASALKGVVSVGAVDMTKHESVGAPFKVQGFPTIMLFGGDKAKPQDYPGQRTAVAIAEGGLKLAQSIVRSRLGVGGGGGGGSMSGDVHELDDSSFDSMVLSGGQELWMVAFTAPWCGHCKSLLPEWSDAATELMGAGVLLGNVDATANEALASRFSVKGFPTIKIFGPGATSDADAKDYQGGRTKGEIVDYGLQTFEALGGSIEVVIEELTSASVFDASCGKAKRCTIGFLPDIRDTGVAGRNELIEMLKEVQKSVRRVPVLWVSAGAQPAWEEHFDLRSGFPAAVTLRTNNDEKLGMKVTAGALSAFTTSGKRRSEYKDGWPAVQTTEAWDGEEPPAIEEEDDDFDLADFLSED